MRRIRVGRACTLGLLAAGIASAAAGCSAGGKSYAGTNSGAAGAATDLGGPPVLDPNSLGNGFSIGSQAVNKGCSQLDISFEAQTPTALLVVDRSSSQWDNYPNDTWDPMKAGLLEVVQGVQKDIRIGMVTYTGQNGGTCPDLFPAMDQVTFDKNNYSSIETNLNAVQKPSYKGETPTALTLQQAVPVLLNDPSPGEKVLLLVTDGDPDFCNDPDRICAMDAVIGQVQAAYAKGVTTTVFGLRRAGSEALSEQHLRDVANAGTGQPVAWPQGVNNDTDLRNRCKSNPPGSLSGTYAAQGGSAQFFQANGTDTVALGSALDAAINGIRSCIFDLAGAAQIDSSHAAGATITIDGGAPLLFGDPNGWQQRTETQIELVGNACQQLKNPATKGISFDFPCDTLLPQ
jgi:hypothetical protein